MLNKLFVLVMSLFVAATGIAAPKGAPVPKTPSVETRPAAGNAANTPDELALMAKLKATYKKTQFSSVRQSLVPGIYEVIMGRNIAYTDASARYFFFGHLFDMQTQIDRTEERKVALGLNEPGKQDNGPEARKIDFAALPLADAITTIKGDGSRKMAVFSDPDCPYCKRLEEALAGVDNVTIYTFMFPIDGLHPAARRKTIAVWCSGENQRAKAWTNLVLSGVVPNANCADNPVDRNVELANKLGFNGTPTIVFANGRVVPGAMPAQQINAILAGK